MYHLGGMICFCLLFYSSPDTNNISKHTFGLTVKAVVVKLATKAEPEERFHNSTQFNFTSIIQFSFNSIAPFTIK